MIIVTRNNDLLVWPVVVMMMASDGMNNILVTRGDSRDRGITIVLHSPQTTTITVMVVVVVVVRRARMMNTVIWNSGRQFNADIYFRSMLTTKPQLT
jgi:hypothetical protein